MDSRFDDRRPEQPRDVAITVTASLILLLIFVLVAILS
jgi:hypothetical protein